MKKTPTKLARLKSELLKAEKGLKSARAKRDEVADRLGLELTNIRRGDLVTFADTARARGPYRVLSVTAAFVPGSGLTPLIRVVHPTLGFSQPANARLFVKVFQPFKPYA